MATALQAMELIFQFFAIPHYSFYVDKVTLINSAILAYIYLIGVIRKILQISTHKISFIVVISTNFLFLLLFIYKVRITIIQRRFLKTNKGTRDFQIQLVQLVRLVIQGKSSMIEVL